MQQQQKMQMQPQAIFAILKLTDLCFDMDIEDLYQYQKINLCRNGYATYFNKQSIVLKQPKIELQQFFIIITGEVHITHENKIQILKSNKYFVNSAQDISYKILEGSTILRINYLTLNQNLNNLKLIKIKIQILKNVIPFNCINKKMLRTLCKDTKQYKIRKGQDILSYCHGKIFFLMQGICDITKQDIVICNLSAGICGEQILFQDKYEYQIRAKSSKAYFFGIMKDVIISKLNEDVLQQCKRIYAIKKKFRNQVLMSKLSEKKQQKLRETQIFQENQINIKLKKGTSEKRKTNITDRELNKLFKIQPLKWKHEFIKSKRQNQQLSKQLSERILSNQKSDSDIRNLTRVSKSQKITLSNMYLTMVKKQSRNRLNTSRTLTSPNNKINKWVTQKEIIQNGYRFSDLFSQQSDYLSSSPKKMNSIYDIRNNIEQRMKILKKMTKNKQVGIFTIIDKNNKVLQRKQRMLLQIRAKGQKQ